jgi:hypothetical protein
MIEPPEQAAELPGSSHHRQQPAIKSDPAMMLQLIDPPKKTPPPTASRATMTMPSAERSSNHLLKAKKITNARTIGFQINYFARERV